MSHCDKYSILPRESEVVTIRKVDLTMNEQKKYEVIKNLVDSQGNKNRAAALLSCSRRTVDRLIMAYRQNGKAAFSHGNKGRSPSSSVPTSVKTQVSFLYVNKYFNSNIRHFTELLEKIENISLSENTVRKILLDENILSPKAHKSTRGALLQKLKAERDLASSKRKKNLISEKIMLAEDPHPRRPRCQFAGELVQMDASLHLWFGDRCTTLHAAIDDATGTLLGAYFDTQETLHGYYHVFRQILTSYGIPYMFYTDKRTVFEYKLKKSPSLENDTFTQFSYACKQLGVALKTTSVPQAKGRVERLFQTLQSRLPIELRLAGVTTIEQANEFLASYLKAFNLRFALAMDCIKSVFEKQPDSERIDLFLSILVPRKIDAGHCIRFQNKYYTLMDQHGNRSDFCKGTSAMVIKTLSGKLYASVNETVYCLEEVPVQEPVSRYFDSDEKRRESQKKRKRYIPDMNHPWRKDNFMKHVYAMLGKEEGWAG